MAADDDKYEHIYQHGGIVTVLKSHGLSAAQECSQLCPSAPSSRATLAEKAAIVAQDEHESDTRALLNLGHTFGHAFEAEAGFDDLLLHGEGVAFGTVCAFDLSHRLELCSGQEVERVRSHFTEIGLPTNIEGIAKPHWTPDVILTHMGKDKKTDGGNLTFILARGIGQAYIDRDVPIDTLRAFLSDILPS